VKGARHGRHGQDRVGGVPHDHVFVRASSERRTATRPEVVEVRMSMPNKHHFVVDLSPFGLTNDNEVFHADDRPYGLIEAAVLDDGAPDPGPAWDPYPML
jgi:urate oxidase